jgi:hypothetical protein
MKLRESLAGIDANLDDLQAGMEASSRATDNLQIDTSKFNGLLRTPLVCSFVRHLKELQACRRDERAALRELRTSFGRLREELHQAQRASIRPPPAALTLQPERR